MSKIFNHLKYGKRSKKNQALFVQQPEKTGRLVTAELESALKECKETVDRISKDCRAKNRKFRDHEFDLYNDQDRCLNGLEGPGGLEPSDVQRVTDIFENPRFFVDGANSNDIVQGSLGDCWFVSALATMSTAEGLVEKFCVARDEKVGVYGFIFFRDGKWVTVIIDDLLYTSIPKFEELNSAEKALYHNDKKRYDDSARKGSKSLYFATSGTEGETWVPLIEKAYAKLHGSYGALSGGEACEAIEDLTGGVSCFIPTKDILDPEKFWNDELLKANKDRLFGVAYNNLDTSRSGLYQATVNGLIGGHAYSVLRAVEVKGKKFVVVRNPWGQSEWNGPWSDGSKEWTAEWLQVLPKLGHVFGDDGEFVMEYDDFLSCWEDVDRTILFDSRWKMSTQWLHVTARPLPSAWSYGDVSFTICVPEATPAMIVLSQVDHRFFREISGRCYWTFDFVVFKQGEKTVYTESSHSRPLSRSVNVEVELEAGDYVVHVRLDRRVYRPPNYWDDNWNERKLSRTLTERAKSRSIAINFDPSTQARHLPIPLDVLAGQDLAQLEEKAKAKAKADVKASGGDSEDGKDDSEDNEEDSKKEEKETPKDVKEKKEDDEEKKDEDEEKKDEAEEKKDEAEDKTEGGENDDDDDDTESSATSESDEVGRVSAPPMDDDTDGIVLGLRVYTVSEAPVEICGQLRHELEITADLAL